jgi:hypothetical protein
MKWQHELYGWDNRKFLFLGTFCSIFLGNDSIEDTNRALKEFLSSSPFDYSYSWDNRKLDDEDYML